MTLEESQQFSLIPTIFFCLTKTLLIDLGSLYSSGIDGGSGGGAGGVGACGSVGL